MILISPAPYSYRGVALLICHLTMRRFWWCELSVWSLCVLPVLAWGSSAWPQAWKQNKPLFHLSLSLVYRILAIVKLSLTTSLINPVLERWSSVSQQSEKKKKEKCANRILRQIWTFVLALFNVYARGQAALRVLRNGAEPVALIITDKWRRDLKLSQAFCLSLLFSWKASKQKHMKKCLLQQHDYARGSRLEKRNLIKDVETFSSPWVRFG